MFLNLLCMKTIITLFFIYFLSASICFSQNVFVDLENDTSYNFQVTSECFNTEDYPYMEEGYTINWFAPEGIAEIDITIIKNCGQNALIDILFQNDTIFLNQTDTGELATCECYQEFQLTIYNLYDSVAFIYQEQDAKLKNPYYNKVKTIDDNNISVLFNMSEKFLIIKSDELIKNNFDLKIFDLQGRIRMVKKIIGLYNEIQLNLPDGIYFYFIGQGINTLSGKFVIIK